jgi:hypothetical protein
MKKTENYDDKFFAQIGVVCPLKKFQLHICRDENIKRGNFKSRKLLEINLDVKKLVLMLTKTNFTEE